MPTALILNAPGINCDRELGQAFELAGATAEAVHLNQLLRQPALIDRFDLIGLPGGFSYGDAIGAGRIAAALMRQRLYPAFVSAIERGVPIIAPCNGFQIAVQVGLLPGPDPGAAWPSAPPRPSVALAPNESARFVDRWCGIEIPPETGCIWTQGIDVDGERAVLPVAHGEGRFLAGADDGPARLASAGQIAVRYRAGDNPNGSVGNIAGICDASGLVLGLMPHPERFTRWTQHPRWTRLDESWFTAAPLGLAMFRNAVAHVGRPDGVEHASLRPASGDRIVPRGS
ncbi:MAG: phosphoribosylformylglycinamidine synthase subunit PurQ [Planctomycetota bacterium]|jgi:phosphoribosylformylglycinamidine synthase